MNPTIILLVLASLLLIFVVLSNIKSYRQKQVCPVRNLKEDTIFYKTPLPLSTCIARLKQEEDEADFVYYTFEYWEDMQAGTLTFTGLKAYAKRTATKFSIKFTIQPDGTLIEMHWLSEMFLTATPVTFDNLVDPFMAQKLQAQSI
ncbi:MAG: hypothetical protein PHG02_01060 [Oscillospiraceae bacterium]|nr:hypothetical protein [Oscillospiraceae bacterium]